MALSDKDRIFTNLYGYQPWNLKAAQARGDWDQTKKLLERGVGVPKAAVRDPAAEFKTWLGA